jgi:hypothetical protein
MLGNGTPTAEPVRPPRETASVLFRALLAAGQIAMHE